MGSNPAFAIFQFTILPKLLNLPLCKTRITILDLSTRLGTQSIATATFQIQWEDHGLSSDKPGFKARVYYILGSDLRHIIESVPQFPHLKNSHDASSHLIVLVSGLSEIRPLKLLALCLAQGISSINGDHWS